MLVLQEIKYFRVRFNIITVISTSINEGIPKTLSSETAEAISRSHLGLIYLQPINSFSGSSEPVREKTFSSASW